MRSDKAVLAFVRPAIYVAAIGAIALIAPETARAVLVSSCSVVLEALPYLIAGAVARALPGRAAGWAVAYAGCGCSAGPGARSIPVAYATAALFSPPVALARWVAALAVARLRRIDRDECAHAPSLLAELAALAPSALACGFVVTLAPSLSPAHAHPLVQLAFGTLVGFFATPCALGGVALAATFRTTAPIVSIAILCVSGICDRGVWFHRRRANAQPDRATYFILAAACAITAAAHGASLVHPRLAIPLACCAAYLVWRGARTEPCTWRVRHALAALLLAACIIGSPPPPEIASEATIDDGYAGERIDFTGRYDERNGTAQVVRYAITCCRADARPVGIRIAREHTEDRGRWVRVRGAIRETASGPVVDADALDVVAPPADPFIYR